MLASADRPAASTAPPDQAAGIEAAFSALEDDLRRVGLPVRLGAHESIGEQRPTSIAALDAGRLAGAIRAADRFNRLAQLYDLEPPER